MTFSVCIILYDSLVYGGCTTSCCVLSCWCSQSQMPAEHQRCRFTVIGRLKQPNSSFSSLLWATSLWKGPNLICIALHSLKVCEGIKKKHNTIKSWHNRSQPERHWGVKTPIGKEDLQQKQAQGGWPSASLG